MKQGFNCPVCAQEVFSGIGKGCRLCGMLLEEEKENFCCSDCEETYNNIHFIIK